MLATMIFAAILLGAVVFMLRFLVAICGQEGKAPRIVYMAQVAPECGDPAGGQKEPGGTALFLDRGTLVHRRTVPTHARQGVHPPKKVWAGIVAGRRSGSRG